MRWYIIRALLHKELMRHIADRGGIFIVLLLLAAVILLRFVGKKANQAAGAGVIGGVGRYYVDCWERDSPWMQHLYDNRPSNLNIEVRYPGDQIKDPNAIIHYGVSEAAVQVRVYDQKDAQGRNRYKIMFWQPGEDPADIGPFADWFWKETCRYFRDTPVRVDSVGTAPVPRPEQAIIEVEPLGADAAGKPRSRYIFWPGAVSGNGSATLAEWWHKEVARLMPPAVEMDVEQKELVDNTDIRTMIATGLVFFGICIFCVYLMPALTCEERERGVLMAQALSPASPVEILAAKFLFYPTLGLTLSALLAGIYRPFVLFHPFFWLCMGAIAIGYLGVGQTIASLARTQRRASLGALCYFLAVALLLLITSLNGIPVLQYLFLEYYVARMLHDALRAKVVLLDWIYLLDAWVLALGWAALATYLFRRRGWQ